MTKEAEENAEEDKKKKELIDAKNSAEALIITAEKSIADLKDLPEDDKKGLESLISDVKKSLEGDNKDEIEEKTKTLSESLSKVGEKMYSQGDKSQDGASDTADEKKEPEKDQKDAEEGEVVDDNKS